MIDLLKLAIECKEISDTRFKNGSVGSDILKHCAGEVAEAIVARETLGYSSSNHEVYEALNNYGLELADIIICGLTAFAEEGLDPEEFIYKKIKINKLRAEGNGDKL